MRWFRPILNANGVTEQQWRVLRVLLERGPMEPRELVRACTISSPSLAGILARMDDLGLISRGPVNGDQRRVMVSLTRKSRALAARIAPRVDAAYAALESRLGARFTHDLYEMLDELVERLDGEAEIEAEGEGVGAPEIAGDGRRHRDRLGRVRRVAA